MHEVIGSAIAGGANLAGSVLGFLGQKDTNKQNLRIAQETNAINRQIAQEANENTYKMFRENLAYQSPANQRKLLLEAGYNPASLTQNGYNQVSQQSPTAQVGNPMQAARLENPLAYASQLGRIAQDYLAISQAKKANEEANNLKLINSTYMERFGQEMTALGLGNEWQKIKNDFDSENFGQQIQQAGKQLKLSDLQIQRQQLEYQIYQTYGAKKAQKVIEDLDATIALNKEKKNTELTQQDLNRSLRKKSIADAALSYVSAEVQKYLAPHQAGALDASAEASRQTAENQYQQAWEHYVNTTNMRKYQGKEWYNKIENLVKSGNLTEQNIENLKQEVKKMQSDIDKTTFDKWIDGLDMYLKFTKMIPGLKIF